MSVGRVIVVQGGQYGSESKGQVAAWYTKRHSIPYVVRTGSINAGHTVEYQGQQFKLQQIPTAWVDLRANLFIGAGAYIHPAVLAREIEMINAVTRDDVRKRLYIDRRCGIHLPEHEKAAKDAGRHVQMGATGKGCAEAIIDKIKDRDPGRPHLFVDYMKSVFNWGPPYELLRGLRVVDTVDLLNDGLQNGLSVLVEGTQGTLLDLHHGDYPFVTSRQTTSAAWLAEAGISPSWDVHVVLVMRTFPIRVAGNSGPMPNEIRWQDLWDKWRGYPAAPQVSEGVRSAWESAVDKAARSMGWTDPENFALVHPTLSPETRIRYREALSGAQSAAFGHMMPKDAAIVREAIELTTVTHKPRRIAQWSMEEAIRAAKIEKPSEIVMTFMNYRWPEMWGRQDTTPVEAALWLGDVSGAMDALITTISTGPGESGLISGIA